MSNEQESAPLSPEDEIKNVTEKVMQAANSLGEWNQNVINAGYIPARYVRYGSKPDDLVDMMIAGASRYRELESEIAGEDNQKLHEEFPEFIGQDYELWQKYHEMHGKEAYTYRRLYEEEAHLLTEIYKFAEEHGIDLPNTGPDFT